MMGKTALDTRELLQVELNGAFAQFEQELVVEKNVQTRA